MVRHCWILPSLLVGGVWLCPKIVSNFSSNAGGGGERVLWAAIEATQKHYPNAICAVYTGDHEITKDLLLATVKKRFDITLQPHSLHFVFLSRRYFVLAATYPYFTLLGQSLGSLVLAYEAFSMLVPDIFVDTMGYAFVVAFCKYLFPDVPTGAYIHYPTISTDMLDSLDDRSGTKGMHSGAGIGLRGRVKKGYWHLFAQLYGRVGQKVDVVMCNSTWTAGHISKLWNIDRPWIIYPPCPVHEIENKIPINEQTETQRQPIVLYVAQFRPEKNHGLILRSFATFFHGQPNDRKPKLVLIGSVRANTSDERHIYKLRLDARDLKIDSHTGFICDAPFSTILEYLQKSDIGVNGMYAEHFGIGNVEGLAAGLIPVVHNSGGPKLDIVVPYEGHDIGYHAETEAEYADALARISNFSPAEKLEMRLRCRKSAQRFTGEVFEQKWMESMAALVSLQQQKK